MPCRAISAGSPMWRRPAESPPTGCRSGITPRRWSPRRAPLRARPGGGYCWALFYTVIPLSRRTACQGTAGYWKINEALPSYRWVRAMPLYIVLIGFDLLCAVHVVKTRRPLYWVFIILVIPGLGSLVYFIAEMLPDLLHSREAKQAVHGARKAMDPERDYRALADQFDTVDTVANRQALAEECLRLGKTEQAITLYQGALAGIHKTDPMIMHALARAYFAAGDFASCTRTLEALRAANPTFESADAHLLYARGLEGEGRRGEALPEYEAVSRYFAG